MATLFEITDEFRRLYEMATDEDVDEEAFAGSLECLMSEFELKAAGYANVIKQIEMEAKQAAEIEKEFKRKKEIRENRVKKLKEAIKSTMMIAGVDEVGAGKFTFKLKGNGGLQPMKIDGEVPDNYKRIVVEDDHELIRKRLEEGVKLPFAHLEPRGKHIEIK